MCVRACMRGLCVWGVWVRVVRVCACVWVYVSIHPVATQIYAKQASYCRIHLCVLCSIRVQECISATVCACVCGCLCIHVCVCVCVFVRPAAAQLRLLQLESDFTRGITVLDIGSSPFCTIAHGSLSMDLSWIGKLLTVWRKNLIQRFK